MLFAALACLSLGLPRTMLRAVSSTLFLSQYLASSFAYVYLVVAALIPVTTLLFLQLEKRLSPLAALL